MLPKSTGPGRPGWLSTQAPHRSGRARRRGIRLVTLWNRCPTHDWVVSQAHAGEAQCPRRGSNAPSTTRHPLRSTGSGGPFPRFSATMGHSDSLPSISPRFVSFAWRYQRCVPCSSPAAQDRAADQPGVGKPVLQPAVTMETARSPKFPGNPFDHSPCSPTPARPGTLVGPSVANAWHGPRT
jgi:hypothetical protein